ncbi:YdhR family protein [Thiocystis violacea]|uniref:YdhR family protein n=1 Tax=Thiocystis violacea TaxID=13725 RepID=UPI001903D124|nr:YdhR family protein [Thiocystis violacea]MBK1717910.1 hypothetical protein [Thiocystis violacea]
MADTQGGDRGRISPHLGFVGANPESAAARPGGWKIWTENPDTGEVGGIDLFNDRASAQSYRTMQGQRPQALGISGINGKLFDVNPELSRIDRAPL